MIAILNTTISVTPGVFAHVDITLEQARALIAPGLRSHIGHESTAAIVSALLGVEVPVDRTPFGGSCAALCFKMNGRPPEGRILSTEEIEGIGYSWRMLVPLAPIPHEGDRVLYRGPDEAGWLHRGTVGRRGTYPVVHQDGYGVPFGTIVVDIVPDNDDGQGAAYPVALSRVLGLV